jgi:hypothetical protein
MIRGGRLGHGMLQLLRLGQYVLAVIDPHTLGFPPAPVVAVDDRRIGETVRTVPKSLDAVLDDDGQVLVAAQVASQGTPQFAQTVVAAGLRPAVAVQVGQQAIRLGAVHVYGAAERGLRERRLDPGTGPGW